MSASPPPARLARLVGAAQEHPRPALALRAALAAAVAWWLAGLLPGQAAADYPYYAPMGAVVATSTTLAGSVRESLQAVAAIALGGAVGVLAGLAGAPGSLLVVALAVAAAVLLAGWRPLGAACSWVPIAALFTLVIGHGQASYAGAYAGLVLVGAAVGLAVTLLLPPLPLAPARAAVARARGDLRRQLDELAEALEGQEAPDADTWRRHRLLLAPRLTAVRHEVDLATEAARANPRARGRRGDLTGLRQQAAALERLGRLVAELAELLTEEETSGVAVPALGPALRPPAASALRATGALLGSVRDGRPDPDAVERARRALEDLVDRTGAAARPDLPAGGTLAAGALATALRRCLETLAPADDGTTSA